MLAYQRGLLERLVRHARAHVPFYRASGRLDLLFRRDDTIDWERWPQLPPLTRKDLQESHEQLKSEYIPAEQGRIISMTTSGSSGEPVRVLASELARWAAAALKLRDFEWHRIDTSKRLALLYWRMVHRTREAGHADQKMFRNAVWNPLFGGLAPAGERIEIADTLPGPELVDTIVAVRPTYLQGVSTVLQSLIAHDRNRRLSDLKLGAVFSFAENFDRELKQQAEAHFGCRILEIYATSECGYLAGSCPHCGGFHFHAEVALVEPIADDGTPAQPGEVGRLIVTPFYNYIMPLIRYDHADFARVAPGRCQITLPAFDEILGKRRPPFVFPDGRKVRPTLPTIWVMDYLGARIYQVAQVAPDRCEIRFVPGSMAPSDMRFDELTKRLRSVWWDGLQIDYRIVDALPRRTASSKLQFIVQEMPGVTDTYWNEPLSAPSG
jgi:phenylacetate-CoA ligase